MKSRNIVISVLLGLLLAGAASLTASAQYVQPASDQFLVNQPYGTASNIVPPANFAQQQYPYSGVNAPYPAPFDTAALSPYATCATPLAAPLVAPFAAPVTACGPYTSGFTYSATQSSAFGPFAPPVSQATEQFYQYPGLTPFGAYPGAGYAAAGGVGFDPMSGYYGPYGAYTPIL